MDFIHLSDGYLLSMAGWLCFGAVSFWWLLTRRQMWKGRKTRLRFVHFSLTLWMSCALLTGIEIYFATIYDQTDSFNISNVSIKWFELHVRKDLRDLDFQSGKSTEYRDNQPFPEEPDPKGHHICFAGDSFTFGHGVPDVDDRFSNLIRAELNQKQPKRFIVSNLAKAGTDVEWIERLHKELFDDRRRIDTFVYVICLNDIERLHEGHDAFYSRIGGKKPEFFLFRYTYFFNLLYLRARLFTIPEVKDYYSFVSEFYTGKPWDKMEAILDRIHKRCRDRGTDFRIVIFPFLKNLKSGYRFEKAHEVITGYCKKAGIPVLDLAPVLKPHSDEGLAVNRFDDHPNERAHQLAADAILEKLLADVVDPQKKGTGVGTAKPEGKKAAGKE